MGMQDMKIGKLKMEIWNGKVGYEKWKLGGGK